MNKIYKLKFSRKTNELVAVAEIATNAVAQTTAHSADLELTRWQNSTEPNLTVGNSLSQTLVKYGLLAGSAVTLSLGSALPAWAGNGLVDPTVVAGSATIATNGSVTTITNSPNTIINWQQFNIGKNELVQFIQESSNSAVLNRVLGNEVSEILGTLKSNGKVFLINPNGILFGANAVVDTSSLVASTLNMSDADFQAGKYVFNQEKDRAIASVLNQGVIKVQNDGTLALVGGNVVNTGILEAKNGSVYLLAGQSIQIADLNNPLISFKVTAGNKAVNLGEIVAKNVTMLAHGVNHGKDLVGNAFADLYTSGSANSSRISATGEVELYAGSVSDQLQTNQQTNAQVSGERSGLVVVNGDIVTTNATGTAGSVKVLGDTVYVGKDSLIDASGSFGGKVNVGGDYQGRGDLKLAQQTTLVAGQEISVAGKGDAGTAIIWGDTLAVDGTLKATSQTGKGGLIETSGETLRVGKNISVDTRSWAGKEATGLWLLDPHTMRVVTPDSGVTEDPEKTTSGGKDVYGTEDNWSHDNLTVVYNTTIEDSLKYTDVQLLAWDIIRFESVSITGRDHDLYIKGINIILTGSTLDVKGLHVNPGRAGGVSFTATDSKIYLKDLDFNLTSGGKLERTTLCVTNSYHFNTTGYAFTGSTVWVNTTADVVTNGSRNFSFTDTTFDAPSSSIVFNISNPTEATQGGITFSGGRLHSPRSITLNINRGFNSIGADVTAGNGDFIFNSASGGSLNFSNGGTTTIHGNLTVNTTGGEFRIFNTNATIDGNVTVQGQVDTATNTKGRASNVQINNTNSQYVVDIKKDVTHYGAGWLEVIGDVKVGGNLHSDSSGNALAAFRDGTTTVTGDVCITISDGYVTLKNGALTTKSFTVNVPTDGSSNASIETFTNYSLKTTNGNILINYTGDRNFKMANSNFSAGTHNVTFKTNRGWVGTIDNINVSAQNFDLVLVNSGNYFVVNSSNISVTGNINITSGAGDVWRNDQSYSITGTNLTAGGNIVLKGNDNENNLSNSNISGSAIDATFKNNLQAVATVIKGKSDVNISVAGAATTPKIENAIFEGKTLNISLEGGNLTVFGSNLTSTEGATKLAANNLTLNISNVSANTALIANFTKLDINASQLHSRFGEMTLGNGSATDILVTKSCFTSGLKTGDANTGNADTIHDVNITVHNVAITGSVFNSSKSILVNASGGNNVTVADSNLTASGQHNVVVLATQNISVTNSNISGGGLTLHSEQQNISLTCVTGRMTGDINISAHNNVKIENSPLSKSSVKVNQYADKVAANVDIYAQCGSVVLNNVPLLVENKLNITAHDNVDLVNTRGKGLDLIQIGAKQRIEVTAKNGYLNITKTAAQAIDGVIELTSKGQLKIEDVILFGGKETNLTSTENAIILRRGTVRSSAPETHSNANTTNVIACQSVQAFDSSINGGINVNIISNSDSVTLNNTSSSASKGLLNITGNSVTLENGNNKNLSGKTDANIIARTGAVTVDHYNLKAGNNLTFSGKISLDLQDSNGIAEKNLFVREFENVTVASSHLAARNGELSIGSDSIVNFSATSSQLSTGYSQAEIDENKRVREEEFALNQRYDTPLLPTITTNGDVNVNATNLKLVNSFVKSTQDLNLSSSPKTNFPDVASAVTITGTYVDVARSINITSAAVEINGGVMTTGELLPDGSKNSGVISIEATAGTLCVTNGAKIFADNGPLSLKSTSDLLLESSDVKGTAVDIKATDATASVKVLNATVYASSEAVTITAPKDLTLGNGTNITATTKVDLTATEGSLTATGTNISAGANYDVILKGKKGVALDNTNVSGHNVNAYAGNDPEASVKVANSTVTAKNKLNLTATKDVELSTGSIVKGEAGVEVKAQNGAVRAKDSNITAGNAAPVQVAGQLGVSLDNSNVTGGKVDFYAGAGQDATVKVANSTVTAHKTLNLTATKDVELSTGSLVKGEEGVEVKAKTGAVKAKDSNIRAGNTAPVQVAGQLGVSLDNSNVTGGKVDFYAGAGQDATVKVANSTITAHKTLNLTATKDVELSAGSIVKGEEGVEVKAKTGAVKAKDSNITASKDAPVQVAGQLGVSLDNSNVTGGKVDFYAGTGADATVKVANSTVTAHKTLNLTATKDVTLTNGTKIKGEEGVGINAQGGELIATGSNITAGDTAGVILKGKAGISLDNTNVSGKDISAYAGDGAEATVKVANSSVTAGNKVNLTATKNVELNRGSKVKGENGVEVIATTGAITAKDSNVSGGATSEVTLKGHTGVSLDNANVSGNNVNTFAGDAADAKLTVSNSTVTATNKLNLTATGNVELNRGSIVKGENAVDVKSTSGAVVATNSNITGGTNADVAVVGKQGITLTNSNVSGKNVTTVAGDDNTPATITVTNSSVTAGEKLNLTASQNIQLTNGTKLHGETGAELTAKTGALTSTGSNVTAGSTADVILTGKTGITLANTNVSGANVKAVAGDDTTPATVSISNSSVTAGSKLNVTATKDVTLTNGTKLHGETGAEVTAKNGALTATGSNVTAGDAADVTLAGKTGITLNNTNVSGLNVKAVAGDASTEATVTIGNSSVTAGNKLNVTATKDVTLTNGTKLHGETGAEVTAKNGALTATGSNVTAGDAADVTLAGKTGITLNNTNVSGLNVKAVAGDASTEATVTIGNSSVTAGNKLNVTATKDITLTNGTKLHGEKAVELNAQGGELTAKGTNVTGGDDSVISITGKKGIDLSNTNVTGKDVSVFAGDDQAAKLKVGNSTLTATNKLNLTATNNVELANGTKAKGAAAVEIASKEGAVDATGTNVTGGTDSTVTVTGKQGVTFTNSNLSGKDVATVAGDNPSATVTLNKANLTATNKVNLSATGDVVLNNGTKVQGGKVVELNAKEGKLSATGANITGGADASVTLTGKKGIELANTNLTGKDVAAVAGDDPNAVLTIANSTVSAGNKLNLTATKDVTLSSGTKVKGENEVEVTAKVGTVAVTDSNVTGGANSQVTLVGNTGVKLDNANITGKDTTLYAGDNTDATVTVGNSTVTAINKLNITATKDVTLTNGTKLEGTKEVEITAQNGKLEATGANVTGGENAEVTLVGKTGVSLDNANVTGKDVTDYAGDGTDATVKVANSTVTATNKLNLTATKDVTLTNGTKLEGTKEVEITAQNGKLEATGTNVTGGENAEVTLAGKTGVTLDNANVTGKDVTAYAGDDANAVVKVANSTVTASNKLNLTATKDVTLSNGTKVKGEAGIEVKAKDGAVAVTESNVTGGDNAQVTLAGKTGVTLDNANVTGKDVTAYAGNDANAVVKVANSTVTASNKLNLTATKDVTLSNGTKVKGEAGVEVKAKDGAVTVTESNVTGGDNAQVTLAGKTDVTLDNANVTGKDTTLYAGDNTDATVTVGNSTVTATNKLNITATKDVSLTNGTKLEGTKEVEITAQNGKLEATGTNVTGGDEATITLSGKTGISLDNTNISGKDVSAVAGDDQTSAAITVANSTVTATGKLNVTASSDVTLNKGSKLSGTGEVEVKAGGKVDITDTNVTGSEQAPVTIVGKTGVNLDNSNVTGKDITTVAGDSNNPASVTVAKSNLTATNTLNLTASTDVTLGNGTKVAGANGVEVTAQAGKVAATGANITGGESATVTLKGQTGVALDNTNVTGKDVTAVAGDATHPADVTVANSTVTATNKLNLTASQNVDLSRGSKLSGTNDVAITAQGGTVTAKDTNVTGGDTAEVTLTGKKGISLDNSNVSGKDVSAFAGDDPAASLKVANSSVTAGNKVNLTATNNVELTNGTKVSGTHGVELNAQTGSLSAVGTNVTTTADDGKVDIKGATGVKLDNANVSGQGGVTATATNGKLEALNTNITSTAGDVALKGTDVTLGNGTEVTGKQVSATATTSKLEVTGANIIATADDGKVDLKAVTGIKLDNANVSGQGGVVANATEGKLEVLNSTILAPQGDVDLKGKDVTLGNGTEVKGNNVTVNATTGALAVTGANITATAADGSTTLTAKQDVTLDNANVSGAGTVTAESREGSLTVNNSTVTTPKDLTFTAQNNVSLGNGTSLEGGSVAVTATTGNITLTGANVTSTADTGKVTLEAGKDIKLENANVSGKGGVTATATDGNVVANNSGIDSSAGDVNLQGHEVTLGKGTEVTGNSVTATATEGAVTVTGANVTATSDKGSVNLDAKTDVKLGNANISGKGGVTATATDGNVVANNSGIESSAGDVNLQGHEVTLGNGTEVTGNSVTATATTGAVTVTGANVTATGDKGAVNLDAKTDVKLGNANVSGKGGVTASATDGNVVANNSGIESSAGDVNLQGHEVTLGNGTEVTGNSVTATATEGAVTVTGANVTATGEKGSVNLDAKTDVKLDNANVSGKGGVTATAADGNVVANNSGIESSAGDVNLQGHEVTLGNGTEVTGNSVTAKATTGAVTFTGANVTATGEKGSVNLDAKTDVKLNNANVSGKGGVTATADGDVEVKNSGIVADKGPVELTGKNVSLGNGTKVAGDSVSMEATEGDLSLTGTNVTSDVGAVDLKGSSNVKLDNTNVSGKTDVSITAATGDANVTGGEVLANTGKLNVTAGNDANLDNTFVFGKEAVNVTAGHDANLNKAEVGSNGTTTIHADNNLGLTGGTGILSPQGINATAGNKLTLEKADLISTRGEVNLTGMKETDVQDSTVKAGAGVKVDTPEGTTTVGNSSLKTNAGDAVVAGRDGVTLTNGTKVESTKGNVEVTSPDGKVSVTGTNLTAHAGKVDLTGKDGIELVNTNISSQQGVNLDGEDGPITVTDSGVKALGGKVTATATGDVDLENVKVAGGTGIEVKSEAGNTNLDKVATTTVKGPIEVSGNKGASVTDSSMTSKDGDVTVSSDAGPTEVTGSNVAAGNGSVDILGASGTKLENTNATAAQDVNVTAPNGTVAVTGGKLGSDKGDVNVNGDQGTIVTDADTGAGQNVNIGSTHGTTAVTGGNHTAQQGDVTFSGENGVQVTNTTTGAGKDVIINSPNGNTTVEGNKVAAGNVVNITAPNGSTVVQGNDFDSSGLLASAGEDLTFTGNHIVVDGPVRLGTENGTLTIQGNTGEGTSLTLKYPSPSKLVERDNPWMFQARVSETANYPTVTFDLEDPINPQDFLNNELYVDSQRMSFSTIMFADGEVQLVDGGRANPHEKVTLLSSDESVTGEFGAEGKQEQPAALPGQDLPLPLGSCPVQAQAIATKYGMSAADYSGMTLDQLKRKYKMTDADAQTMQSSCNINFDWNKMSINQFLGK